MNRYVMDTNHVSAMLGKNAALLRKTNAIGGKSKLSITIPSIAELWFMVFNSGRIQKNTDDLIVVLDDLARWDLTEEAAREFGRIKAELRRNGRPIPDADTQIAAIARVNDLVLLTADAHFSYVADLKTENWLA